MEETTSACAVQENSGTQSSSYLDLNGIEAAITYLTDTWPHQQLTASQREAWADVLCQFRQGELKPALRRLGGRFRPDPYAVLEAVMGDRGSLRAPDFEPKPDEPLTPGASAAAERVFSQFAHLMPSRRNRVSA